MEAASAVPVSACVVSVDPLIVYTSRAEGFPFGMAGPFADRYPSVPATFLVYFPWTEESEDQAAILRRDVRAWQARGTRASVILCANSSGEQASLERAGVRSVLLNHNIAVLDEAFSVSEAASEPDFDAVYNAKLDPWKRHELAADIPRVAYVTYYWAGQGPKEAMRQRLAGLSGRAGHRVINPVRDGLPDFMAKPDINAAYARASVGLCLSAKEGAMVASIEYLLAGLPIVNTPNLGGRDHFFDDDYCVTVPPDPRQIRDATAALQARHIPRRQVRARTLVRLESERRRALALFDLICRGQRRPTPLWDRFPLAGRGINFGPPAVQMTMLDEAVRSAMSARQPAPGQQA